MKITEATKGHWDRIFHHYKIPITSGNKHHSGPCPLCRKKGKFRLYKGWIYTGAYVCVCSNGNGIALIMNLRQLPFVEVCKELEKLLGLKTKTPTKKSETIIIDKLKPLMKFNSLKSLKGTPGETYLLNRGIEILPFKNVRYSEEEYYDKHNAYPAMYALATTDTNEIAYAHSTFILMGYPVKKDPNKKMYKINNVYDNSICVRMFPIRETMGIAEGIETALSAAQMYDLPVWASMNSIYLKKFKAPKGIKHLFIYADNDNNGTGLEAAFTCARANILMPNDVELIDIMWPRQRGDFNDILTDKIPNDILKWRLDRL